MSAKVVTMSSMGWAARIAWGSARAEVPQTAELNATGAAALIKPP